MPNSPCQHSFVLFRCPQSVLFIEADQDTSEYNAKKITALANDYKDVPDDIQNLQSFITQGTLSGFSAPEGLLCVDDDCDARELAMPGTCLACTCAHGAESDCRVNVDISFPDSGGTLTLDNYESMKKPFIEMAKVHETMVSLVFDEEDADIVTVSISVKYPSNAVELYTALQENVQSISQSIADASDRTMKVKKIVKTSDSKSGWENPGDVVHPEASQDQEGSDVGNDGGDKTGLIIALAVGGCCFVLGLIVLWYKSKKKKMPASTGLDEDTAVGVLELGSGVTQKTQIRGKRASMANPLTVEQGQQHSDDEEELSLDMKKAGWAKAVDSEGDYYFYNHSQGISTYDLPVLKDGQWVAASDSEEESEEEEEEEEEGNKKVKLSSKRHSTEKGSPLVSNNVKGSRSKSLAVNSRKRSMDGLKHQQKNRINKKSMSLAIGSKPLNRVNKKSMSLAAGSRPLDNSSFQIKKSSLLGKPAIPIVKELPKQEEEEEEGEEGEKLTQAMENAGWKVATDDEGDIYFYNHKRGESTYELPVLKGGEWVAASDDEEEDDDDDE